MYGSVASRAYCSEPSLLLRAELIAPSRAKCMAWLRAELNVWLGSEPSLLLRVELNVRLGSESSLVRSEPS